MTRALLIIGCLLSLVVAVPVFAGESREESTASAPTNGAAEGKWTLAALAADWRWRQEVVDKLERTTGTQDDGEGAAD